MYEIILSRQAARYVERLDQTAQLRIVNRLEQLAKTPLGCLPNRSRMLKACGRAGWALGAPRGEVYRRL